MPDATGFLIEHADSEGETRYEHIADHERAIEYLRQLVGQGKTAILYQIVHFEVQIGVTVKAPRKRRKTPPPADKPGSDTPTGPGNGEAGESKGAASPQAAERSGTATAGAETAGPNPTSPVFDCEARFYGDPACPGFVERDPTTGGWFCALHMQCIPLSGRAEYHRLHSSRNRPVRVAHAG